MRVSSPEVEACLKSNNAFKKPSMHGKLLLIMHVKASGSYVGSGFLFSSLVSAPCQ